LLSLPERLQMTESNLSEAGRKNKVRSVVSVELIQRAIAMEVEEAALEALTYQR
jgi:hypothetical protein